MIREDIEARNAFLFTLEWLLAVTERYASPIEFGLAHIAYGNRQVLGDTYGAEEAVRQLIEVSRSLRQVFRKTDLVARDGTDLWILTPYTPATERISDKIMEIMEMASHHGLHVVDRDISIFSLPMADARQEANADILQFLMHLKENRDIYTRHNIRLPAIN
jgi:GGDEF domain-containing protein